MDNKTELETQRWVEERMALLAVPDDWEPDTDEARARFHKQIAQPRRGQLRIWLPRVAMAGLACLVLLFAIPKTRAWTERLWQWLTVRKVDVVQADFERLRGKWLFPQMIIATSVEAPGGPQEHPAPLDLQEAAQRAGFWPRLPVDGVLPGQPDFMTLDPAVWTATLKSADLESSLREAGVVDQPIPEGWDGAQLGIHVGSSIFANWPEAGVGLVQHRAIAFSAPPGFDFVEYWTAALRAAGVNREQARQLAERITTTPTLLLGIPARQRVAIREVNLRNGPATLIEHVGKTGRVELVILIWSDADRVYHLNASNEEQAIRTANSIGPEADATLVVPEFTSAGDFPIGSYEIKGMGSIIFSADRRVVVENLQGKQVLEGLFTTDGDALVIKDMKEMHGETEKGCAGDGRYRWGFDGKALRLGRITDDCQGRAHALTAGPLAVVKGTK
ncbi:MAG TPA: hypothetical protein VFV34_18065 [Blastocatellia bacterium]|nr:hypothetical protein [Blastocatellia bacterium]